MVGIIIAIYPHSTCKKVTVSFLQSWTRAWSIVDAQEIFVKLMNKWAPLVAQTVKNLPIVQETQVQSLVSEDPLEKGMATHSSSLAWRIPRSVEPGGLQSMGLQRVGHD